MAETVQPRGPKTTDNNANQTHYYKTLVVAIALGLIGTFIRFVPDVCTSMGQQTFLFSAIANIAMIVAALIAFKTVFGILGFGKNRD